MSYFCESSGQHLLRVKYKTFTLSTFSVDVQKPKEEIEQIPPAKIYGPGLEQEVFQNQELSFTVDCKEAEKGLSFLKICFFLVFGNFLSSFFLFLVICFVF